MTIVRAMLPNNTVDYVAAGAYMDNWRKELGYSTDYDLLCATMLLVKNLDASSVTVEKLAELFPDAADIVIASKPIDFSGALKGTLHAYILYATEHAATATFETANSTPISFADRQLVVLRYREYPKQVPEGYLTMRARRLVMRQLRRASECCANVAPTDKARSLWPERLERARELIEKDDAARDVLGLTKPSYEELEQDQEQSGTTQSCTESLNNLGLKNTGLDMTGDTASANRPSSAHRLQALPMFNLHKSDFHRPRGNPRGRRGIPSITTMRFPRLPGPRDFLLESAGYGVFRGLGRSFLCDRRGIPVPVPAPPGFSVSRVGIPADQARSYAMQRKQVMDAVTGRNDYVSFE